MQKYEFQKCTIILGFSKSGYICDSIPNQPTTFVYNSYGRFASLELVDCCYGDENLEVDMLIRVD